MLRTKTQSIVVALILAIIAGLIVEQFDPTYYIFILNTPAFISKVIEWFVLFFSIVLAIRLIIHFGAVIGSTFEKILYAIIFGEWINVAITKLTFTIIPSESWFKDSTYGWPFKHLNSDFPDFGFPTGTWQNFLFWSVVIFLILGGLRRTVRYLRR